MSIDLRKDPQAVIDAALTRLDNAAQAARRRALAARGTSRHAMLLDLADAASDRADGFRAARDDLADVPDDQRRAWVTVLLRVKPDPEDDRAYDDGYRAALQVVADH